jgi:hypothetical protein
MPVRGIKTKPIFCTTYAAESSGLEGSRELLFF